MAIKLTKAKKHILNILYQFTCVPKTPLIRGMKRYYSYDAHKAIKNDYDNLKEEGLITEALRERRKIVQLSPKGVERLNEENPQLYPLPKSSRLNGGIGTINSNNISTAQIAMFISSQQIRALYSDKPSLKTLIEIINKKSATFKSDKYKYEESKTNEWRKRFYICPPNTEEEESIQRKAIYEYLEKEGYYYNLSEIRSLISQENSGELILGSSRISGIIIKSNKLFFIFETKKRLKKLNTVTLGQTIKLITNLFKNAAISTEINAIIFGGADLKILPRFLGIVDDGLTIEQKKFSLSVINNSLSFYNIESFINGKILFIPQTSSGEYSLRLATDKIAEIEHRRRLEESGKVRYAYGDTIVSVEGNSRVLDLTLINLRDMEEQMAHQRQTIIIAHKSQVKALKGILSTSKISDIYKYYNGEILC